MAFIFANVAKSTLAAPVGISDTSVTLSAGSGALFPNPTGGDVFALVIVDAGTASLLEVMYCTARTGDVCTVTRAQEGTTARNWTTGDFASHFITKGQAQQFAQLATLLAASGSALIGFSESGAGAVLRTLLDKIRGSVSVHPKDYGCVCDGVTDDTVNFQKMLNDAAAWNVDCGGVSIGLSNGTTKTCADDSTFYCRNVNFVDLGVPTSIPFLTVQGSASGSPISVSAAAATATSLTIPSGTVAAGAKMIISGTNLWNDTTVNTFPSVTMGEYITAGTQSGTTLPITAPLRYDYTTGVTIQVYNMPRLAVVENVTGRSANNALRHNVVTMLNCYSAVARSVVGYNCGYAGIDFSANYYAYSEDCGNMDPGTGLGLEYGVVTAYATRNAIHIRPRGRGCRHVSANGGFVGVIASVTIVDPVGDNQQEGVVDAHAAVDQQHVIFGNTQYSNSGNAKIVSSQARQLTVVGAQAYGLGSPIVWNPACTAYPSSFSATALKIGGNVTAVTVGIASTQPCQSVNVEGDIAGGLGGSSGDGLQVSYSSNLNTTGATPGQVLSTRVRGNISAQQRAVYLIAGTQGQKFGTVDVDATLTVPATAGSFGFYANLNANTDVTNIRLRGVINGGQYGAQLFHTQSADIDIYASGYTTDAAFNYQSGDADALSRFDIRAKIPAVSGSDQHRGQVTVNGATAVTVNNVSVRSLSRIWFQLKTVGGTVGSPPRVGTITAGTSFQVSATAGDTSTYLYWLENPLTGP